MKNQFYHQGDIPFYPLNKIPQGLGKKIVHKGSHVLALGEKTGHRHVITCERPEAMELYEQTNGQFLLKLDMVATVTHEEHLPIVIQPGIYFVGREREKDWFSLTTRQVID